MDALDTLAERLREKAAGSKIDEPAAWRELLDQVELDPTLLAVSTGSPAAAAVRKTRASFRQSLRACRA